MSSIHVPVLASEVMEGLNLSPGMTVVDGTFGGGGHSRLILEQIGFEGTLIAMDRDPKAILEHDAQFDDTDARIELIHDSYHRTAQQLEELGIQRVDAILLDLGLSSDQLEDGQRGFSYHATGPLDLRFDPTSGESASELLQRLPERQIADLIYEFGEERCSRRIASRIAVRRKQRDPVKTAEDLAELVRSCVPRSKNHRIDPATRTFQALRIAVNQELRIVKQAMEDLPMCLREGGRFCVISFHSLEDRIVKHAMREHPDLQVLTKKPIVAAEEETRKNARSRSAKLRISRRATE